jgi:hypothetical protein
MSATRLFLRGTQTEPSTGGNSYDMLPEIGSGNGGVEFSFNSTSFVEAGRFIRQLSAAPDSSSFPTSVRVTALEGTIEYRFRVERYNSSGTFIEAGSYSGLHTTTGTKVETLSFTPSAWNSGDLLVLTTEGRRTGGHGTVRFTVATQDADSYVDATLAAVVPEHELAFAGSVPLAALAGTVEVEVPVHEVALAGTIPTQSLEATAAYLAPAFEVALAGAIALQALAGTLVADPPEHEAAFGGSVPMQVAAATVEHDPPVLGLSFAGATPLQTLAATADALEPAFGASFSASIPAQVGTGTLERDVPVYGLSMAGTTPAQAFAAETEADPPVFAPGFAGTVPTQTLAGTLEADEPEPDTFTASFTGTVPAQALAAELEREVPAYELAHAGAVPLQALSAATAFEADAPDAATIAFAAAVPAQTLAGVVEVTVPEWDCALNGTISAPHLTATLALSGAPGDAPDPWLTLPAPRRITARRAPVRVLGAVERGDAALTLDDASALALDDDSTLAVVTDLPVPGQPTAPRRITTRST